MAVRPIRLFGDPVLREKAPAVVDFDAELRRLVRDLTDTMVEARGVGLAAPQIGVSLRVFTYDVDGTLGHLVNPEIVYASQECEEGEEGCLSFPGLYFPAVRATSVTVRGYSVHGEPLEFSGDHLMARCVQHEIDHLDGVLFIDRLDTPTRKKALRAVREAEWGPLGPPKVKVSPHRTFGLGF